MSLKNKVAIVGADETDEIGIVPDMTPIMMHAQAARNALRDAGIELSEVDGLFTGGIGGMASVQLAEYLGIVPKYTDSTMTGGSSFVIHVEHAAAAIAAGLCSVALITHGETGFSGRNRRGPRGGGFFDSSLPAAQFEVPFGVGGAPSTYSMACMRHMHQYGTTHEQLGEIAVGTR
jgi:acetyl-CoA acetyltransferase